MESLSGHGGSFILGIEESIFQLSPEALCCVLKQDTISSASFWFNPGRQENIMTLMIFLTGT